MPPYCEDAGVSPVEPTLLDVVDRLLDCGVVVRGELWLTVADVDLLFIGADLVIASPDSIGRGRAGPLTPQSSNQLRGLDTPQ